MAAPKTILSTIRKNSENDNSEQLSYVEYGSDKNNKNSLDDDLSKFLSLIEEEDNDDKNSGGSSNSDNKGGSSSSDNKGGSSGEAGGSNLRDKDAELKKKIKQFLSKGTNDMIDANEEELDEIIKGLKKLGISNDKGAELQRIINLKKSRVRTR